eukprot:SAG22_NODE_21730_length_254_cov_1.000000_1_plen_50_part_10
MDGFVSKTTGSVSQGIEGPPVTHRPDRRYQQLRPLGFVVRAEQLAEVDGP